MRRGIKVKGKRLRNQFSTHSRKVRERPIEGVTSGTSARLQERVLVVLVEPLLDLSQQLVVGHAAQSVRESRRVAKVKRHCRRGDDTARLFVGFSTTRRDIFTFFLSLSLSYLDHRNRHLSRAKVCA